MMKIRRNGVTAHRGNSERFPENTLEAFRSGVAVGADWLELDVRYTLDGHLVVIHDATTGRVADADLAVAEATLAELRELDFAFQFRKDAPDCPVARIPTLGEVFSALGAGHGFGISVQPKNVGAEGARAVEEAIRLAAGLGMSGMVGFNDGQLDLMRLVKRLDRRIPVFYDVCEPAPEHLAAALRHGFESLVCLKDNVTAEWVAGVEAAGLVPGAWTVDDEAEFARLQRMGVRRFYTNRPEAFWIQE